MTYAHRCHRASAFGSIVFFVVLAMLGAAFGVQPGVVSADAVESPYDIVNDAAVSWADPWSVYDAGHGKINLSGENSAEATLYVFQESSAGDAQEIITAFLRWSDGMNLVASGTDEAGAQYIMRDVQHDEPVLLYMRGWHDTDTNLVIVAHVWSSLGDFSQTLVSFSDTITLNDAPIFGDLDPEQVLAMFETAAGYDIPRSQADGSSAQAQAGTTGGSQPAAQGCQTLSSPRTEASGRRDLWKYDEEMTLTNGTVIGYRDYWTLAADATPEVFRAMVDDKTFMAGDYPAGTSLGTVWSDLCPVLAGMGTIIEQGTEQGNLYALMTLTTNDGSQLYGVVHILYGHQSNVPLFAIQTGQADGFYIQSGIFINGLPVFEDLDHDALIARLQASETAGSSTTTAATTQGPVPVPTEVPQPQDPGTTGAIPNGGQFTLASGAVISWQDPWSAFGVGEPEKVPLASFNVQFIVRVYPSSERSPEAAATSNAWDEATVAESRAEDTGEYVYVQWFTNSEGTSREHTIVEYTRAWMSADGQWTMSAYLRARVGEFHRYLKLVPETISLDGVPLWAAVDADAAAMAVQESSGMEVLVTDLDAGEFTSVNGTVFAYSSDWMPDTSLGGGPDGLALISGDTMLAVADQAQDPGAETIFEQNFGDFPNIIDHGPTPDGGYYALAWGQTNAGRWMHAIFRTMHAPGTSTPVIVLLITPEGMLDQTLTLMQGVTANGVPVLDGIDPAAAHAVFEADGPTGQPVFTGGQASGNEAGAGDDAMNMRDVIVSVPALPTPGANRIPDAEEEASYTSEIFGYTITWTDAWEPYEDAIEIDDEGYDSYAVESADGTEAGIYIVGGEVDDDFDVQDQVDTWASEEHIEKNEPEGTGILMMDGGRNEGAVVLLGPYQGALWVSVYEVREVDGEFRLHAQFVSPLEDFEDAYNDAQENVAVDGEPVIGYFSTDEIMAELPGG